MNSGFLKSMLVCAELTGLCRDSNDVYFAIVLAELHHPIGQCEKRIVIADTNVASRVKFSPALADDDSASIYLLAAVDLDTAHLRIAVTSVSAA